MRGFSGSRARSLTVGEPEVAPPSLVKLVVVFGSVHGCVETGGDARLREGRGPLLGEHALEAVPVGVNGPGLLRGRPFKERAGARARVLCPRELIFWLGVVPAHREG